MGWLAHLEGMWSGHTPGWSDWGLVLSRDSRERMEVGGGDIYSYANALTATEQHA